MNIAVFGGTFDPIHTGHLRAAKAAASRFRLDQILFVPTGNPPHKPSNALTSFVHRFVMVALACSNDRRFVPSLLEAPRGDGRPHYSVRTVQTLKKFLGPEDNLFFLIGVDAFLDLPHWRDYRRLLDLVNFIVVSRPGFEDQEIRNVVPKDLMAAREARARPHSIRLRESTLYVLRSVNSPVASHHIREAIRAGRPVSSLVPPLVEQYIRKEGLYRRAEPRNRRR